MPTSRPGDDDPIRYLPFWRLLADVSDISLQTYADLVRTANLPRVPQPGWDQTPLAFWSPAFKIRPRNLLSLATAITLNQPLDELISGQPTGSLQPVNLPLEEAEQTIKPMIAGFMRPRKRMFDVLPSLQVNIRESLLVYLPFTEGHLELLHRDLKLAINKGLLQYTANL